MKKRILSLLLALCLVAGMLPTVAYAYDNSNGSTIDSGEFTDDVDNFGTINGGTFNGAVNNHTHSSSINGGTFNSTVNNLSGGNIYDGTFNSTVNNAGGSIIEDGTFNSTVNNESSIIRGGTFYGAVTNKGGSAITGGTFYGAVTNEDDIEGGTFYGTVTGSGTIEDSAKVTVTFDSDGGSTVDEQKVLRGQKATAPTDPTKAGYSFEGWYNGNTKFDFANTPVIENITLTAKWTLKTYHVTLNTNGADSCADLTEYTYGTGATLPTPVKAGYTFAGWYADSSFSGDAVTSISTTDTEDKTFYAKWSEKSDISFSTTPQSYTYDGSAQAFSITGTSVTGFAIAYKQNSQTVTNPTDAGSYDVIITRAEDDTYKAIDVTIRNGLVINPAAPAENPAKKTTARVARGRTLADAAVTNGEILALDGTTVLTGTFAWVDSTKVMSADGTEQMVFTPDNTNYAPITIDVAVSTYTTGGGSSTPTYPPTVTQPDNGSVTVSPKSPKKGDTVTITPKPDAGYTVEQILVMDKNGNAVEVTNNGDGTYSFTQPAGKVNVTVTFMDDNTMLNFFVDVPANAYYYDAVLWAAENGITGGVDDTHFAPNATCTRAQIVTFLWRAAGSPEPENVSSFADVSADSYYAKAVAWAVENGITTGTGDGMFSPNATCTRAQAMAFIWRSQKSVATDGVNPFTDVAADAYYADAVLWAVANGITNGTSDTTFSPNANCTRAQIVTFLYRCLG